MSAETAPVQSTTGAAHNRNGTVDTLDPENLPYSPIELTEEDVDIQSDDEVISGELDNLENLLDTPEQADAREALARNQDLQNLVDDHLQLAFIDLDKQTKADKKADRSFIVRIKPLDPLVPITLKRGRNRMDTKIEKANKKAAGYEKLQKNEEIKLRAEHNPNSKSAPSSMKGDRLATKKLRQKAKASKFEGKKEYLTSAIAKEPARERTDHPVRGTDGYAVLLRSLGVIDERIKARDEMRGTLDTLTAKINAGELDENDSEYIRVRDEVNGWETDEELRETLTRDATETYKKWQLEKKAEGYKNAEKTIGERQMDIDKINNPATSDADREKLVKDSLEWKPVDELIGGDTAAFKAWLEKDALDQRENALKEIDKEEAVTREQYAKSQKEAESSDQKDQKLQMLEAEFQNQTKSLNKKRSDVENTYNIRVRNLRLWLASRSNS
jgi:hypothetical protein